MPKDAKGHGSNQHSGALAGGGAVAAGTGFVAGGIPGAKEAEGLELFNMKASDHSKLRAVSDKSKRIKGTKLPMLASNMNPLGPKHSVTGAKHTLGQRWVGSNLAHNLPIMAPMPRSGILGYRSNVHEAFLKDKPAEEAKLVPKMGKTAAKGAVEGKMTAERGVLRGMRAGRKGAALLTIGGTAAAAKGLHDLHQEKVSKAETSQARHQATVAGAVGLGAVGAGVPVGLGHFQRKYERSARANVRAATKIQPRIGGLRDAKGAQGLKPAMSGKQMAAQNIIGATKGKGNKRALGYHLGRAANEAHFVDVFHNTRKGVAIAGLGGAAYLGHKAHQQKKEGVAKMASGHEAFLEISKRDFSTKQRKKLAAKGDALPDGSFPIKNKKDLKNAEKLEGRSKHPAEVAAYIADKKAELSKSADPFEVIEKFEMPKIGGFASGIKMAGTTTRTLFDGAKAAAPGKIAGIGAKIESAGKGMLNAGVKTPGAAGAGKSLAGSGMARAGRFTAANPGKVGAGVAVGAGGAGAFGVGHHMGRN